MSLSMDNKGRFTAEFDRTRFDGKVRFMDLWIQSAQDPNRVIAFSEIEVSVLQTGTITFDSGFRETDLGKEFKFEGLNLGYQINSLNFLYRFRIEKAGDAYSIIPVQ